jgi:phosphoglycolate phosphatase
MPKAILFDLDGTLVQTRESSWEVFTRVNTEFGLGVRSQEEYFALLEGNLFQALRELAGPRADEVAQRFLALLKTDYHPPFVPGMVDVVKAMAGVCSLAVVSSNATVTIRRILERAKLQHCFSHVFGGDVEPDKRNCVRRFLADAEYLVNRQCSPSYVEDHHPERARQDQIILVTDTVGDVRHAVECGVRVVGVSWGMHTERKLIEAGAEFVAVWPQEILAHLFPNGVGAPACEVAPPAVATSSAATAHHSGCGCYEKTSCGCGSDAALSQASQIRRDRRLASVGLNDTRGAGSAKSSALYDSIQRTSQTGIATGGSTPSHKIPQAIDSLLLDSVRRIGRAGPLHG